MKTDWDTTFRLGNKSTFLFACQAWTGVQFDVVKANELQERIREEMAQIANEVEPKLPRRKLKKSEESEYTMPAKPFKKDGSLSVHMERFVEKHKGIVGSSLTGIVCYGKEYEIVGGTILDADAPMSLSNQDDLKDWFLRQGWEPTYYNIDKVTKKQTSPKIQEAQNICPNLLELDGDLVKQVVRWLSLRNRLAVLTTWLEDERLPYDGRLTADIAGIAASHRKRHSKIVNCPKAEDGVVMGKEMRSLFTVRPGHSLVTCDFAALEARVEAHYCYSCTDGEQYAKDLLEGDIHSKTAKGVWEEELKEFDLNSSTFSKDDPKFKPFRSKAKNLRFASAYGAQPKKLSKMLGEPEARGRVLYDKFWKVSAPLAQLRDKLTLFWETEGQKKYIVGLLGAKVMTRSKHALVNTLFQHGGSVCMDVCESIVDKKLGGIQFDEYPYYEFKGHKVRRVMEFHDEMSWEVPVDIACEFGVLLEDSIKETGKFLKMKVPLIGESKVAEDWSKTH